MLRASQHCKGTSLVAGFMATLRSNKFEEDNKLSLELTDELSDCSLSEELCASV